MTTVTSGTAAAFSPPGRLTGSPSAPVTGAEPVRVKGMMLEREERHKRLWVNLELEKGNGETVS